MTKISKEIAPKPIPKNGMQYRILHFKNDKHNPGRIKMPASIRIPSIDTIIDQGDGVQKVIECIKKTDTILDRNGHPVKVNTRMEIFFYANNNGILSINPRSNEDVTIYNYLENCNWNKSNKNRDISVTPLFERMDTESKAEQDVDKAKDILEAINVALNADEDTLREIAVGMKIKVEGVSLDLLRLSMKTQAELHPSLFINKTSKSASDTLTDQVNEAVTRGIIAFDEPSNGWKWLKPKKKNLITVPIGKLEDPVGELVIHLASGDSKKDHEALVSQLEEGAED